MDLSVCIQQPVVIQPGAITRLGTGIKMAIPEGYEGQVRPRSGLGGKGVTIPNSPGTIDSDYRGEVVIILINHSKAPVTINPGDRVAQVVFAPVTRVKVEEVTELDSTVRGDKGFGSTGLQ
jgi:dUTP pyrophosphatase